MNLYVKLHNPTRISYETGAPKCCCCNTLPPPHNIFMGVSPLSPPPATGPKRRRGTADRTHNGTRRSLVPCIVVVVPAISLSKMSPSDVKQTAQGSSVPFSKDEWCHMSIFSPFPPSLAGESGLLGARKNEKCTSRKRSGLGGGGGGGSGLILSSSAELWGKAGSDGGRNKKRAPPPPPLSPPGEIR